MATSYMKTLPDPFRLSESRLPQLFPFRLPVWGRSPVTHVLLQWLPVPVLLQMHAVRAGAGSSSAAEPAQPPLLLPGSLGWLHSQLC